jgi:3'-phosphoadenosine 5'-phosphosulfate sulfotransferase
MSLKTLALAVAAALAAVPLTAQTTIGVGETVTGRLEEGDRQMEDGAYYDAYVIRGRPGETLVVRMTSEDFDTYLGWGRGSGDDWEEEAENDDSGDGTNSRLVVRLTDEGDYELRAAAFEEDQEGEYELRVVALSAPTPGRIRAGETIQGELNENDHEGGNGYEDHYVITGAPGSQITIFAESDELDTFLEFGPVRDGQVDPTASDDDGGRGTNSELVAEFAENGVHHIVVRSFSGEEMGAYTLRVVQGSASENWNDDDPDDEEWVDEDADDDSDDADDGSSDAEDDSDDDSAEEGVAAGRHEIFSIRAGEWQEEDLDENDPQDGDGIYYQQFTYQARAGERLTISATSDELDTFLRIGRGTFNQFETLAEDDDSGGDLNAELSYTVPRTGQYVIQVSSAAPGQTGPYVLIVRSGR